MTICLWDKCKVFQDYFSFYLTLLFEKRFTTDTLLRMTNILLIQICEVRYLRNFLLVRFRHSDTHPLRYYEAFYLKS
jgi:hypothetical protein